MVTKKYKDHKERNKDYIKVRYNNRKGFLHRAIWELVNGKIPEGFMIHHIDGNKKNNNIENLECLSRKEHGKKHKTSCNNK